MTLIARLTQLFQADMHAVLDKIEEPEMLLKQSIREMDESIAGQEQKIRFWEHERQLLTNKQAQLAETLGDLDEKLALCFKADKDDLARLLIKRKLETQQTQSQLAEKLAVLNETLSRLRQQLAEHQAQAAGMKQKAEAFLDQSQSDFSHWQGSPLAVRDEDVEVEFLSEKQKWSVL